MAAGERSVWRKSKRIELWPPRSEDIVEDTVGD